MKKTTANKNDIERMIYDIFKLCDGTVWLEDWFDFQNSFEKILKKFGYDLYPIYFGKTKAEFMRTKKEVYNKWVADKKKAEARANKDVVYIKDRPQPLKANKKKRK